MTIQTKIVIKIEVENIENGNVDTASANDIIINTSAPIPSKQLAESLGHFITGVVIGFIKEDFGRAEFRSGG